jgi:mono/diheme cytochrome c family protein
MKRMRDRLLSLALSPLTLGVALALGASAVAQDAQPGAVPAEVLAAAEGHWGLLSDHCVTCHNFEDWAGGVAFDTMSPENVSQDAEIWEEALLKLRGGLMPPPDEPRPDPARVSAFVSWLESYLNGAAGAPDPGGVALHRLNRTEYANAVRDLLALEIDPRPLLPRDDTSDGFDNVASVLQVSPAFVDQYVNAARQLAAAAVGAPNPKVEVVDLFAPRGVDQSLHVEGLPLGTRGGALFEHAFPANGRYALSIGGLAQAGYVTGTEFAHTVIVTLDGQKIFEASIGGEEDLRAIDQLQAQATAQINARFADIPLEVTAGPHAIGVAFVARSFMESDERLQDYVPGSGQGRMPRIGRIEIVGPFEATGLGSTPSRDRIFVCTPAVEAEEAACAERIFTALARRAFRRPVGAEDLEAPLRFYERARAEGGGFESGVEAGLAAILVSPKFLYRAEPIPEGAEPGTVYRLSDLELAARLSFFLWSSVPDEELIEVAAAGRLGDPEALDAQVERMLADPRAETLTTNFAFQWLRVNGIDDVDPDPTIFPEFNDSLRQAFKEEMRLFIGSVFSEDRSVLELMTADYTFVNERLARHYGVPNVLGERFRRVELADSARWGLLGKGAVLMVTSYPNRTAPVIRGVFILENIMGTPPGTPPPVPAIEENQPGGPVLTIREQMALHRTERSCNSCHGVMDPLGFALENFDAIGGWREHDRMATDPIDSEGTLPDGTVLNGVDNLRKALVREPDLFAQMLTEKLMIYALGRTLEHADMPVVRGIVRAAAAADYRFSALVKAVVASAPFQMKTVPHEDEDLTREAALHE